MSYMRDATGRRLDAVDLTQPLTSTATLPSALGWPSTQYPLGSIALAELPGTPRVVASCAMTAESAFDAASTARTAPGATFYVNIGTGSDSNSGTSAGSPFKSIGAAVTAANTAGVPTQIIVAAGIYGRGNNPSFSGGSSIANYPQVDIAFLASGGRVVTGSFDTIGSPAKDGTYTNCYTIAVTTGTVDRVFDLSTKNRYGSYLDMTNVATAAACNAQPGTWANVGNVLYINRADGGAVTNLNTRYTRNNAKVFAFDRVAPANVYIGSLDGSGWDVMGGTSNGAVDATMTSASAPSRARVLALSNVNLGYTGSTVVTADQGARGLAVDSWNGLIIAQNCTTRANVTDGFNCHNNLTSTPYMLTINCSGIDNGRFPGQSCNGWTQHENCIGIDLGGYYEGNHGGTFRSSFNSKQLAIGTTVIDDLGDVMFQGATHPTAVYADQSATIWCDRVRVLMPSGTYAFYTSASTASIYRRNCWPVQQPDSGPGAFANY